MRIVLHPVFGTLYGKRANTGSLAALRQLVLAQCHAPRFDVLVQFLLVLQASGNRDKLIRTGPRRSAHHLHQSLPFIIGVADNHAPVVVLAWMRTISIMGCNRWPTVVVDQRRAGPVRAVARRKARPTRPSSVHREVQKRRTVERDARYHLRQIDVLASPRHVAMVEAGEGTHRTVHTAGVVHI